MKYIDAEKLKKHIDNLESFSCISEEQDGFYSAISRIIDIIDSLQQEQKDAVEADAEVCKLTERVWITPIDEKKFHQDVYDNFKAGDKVRIIVLKEGE